MTGCGERTYNYVQAFLTNRTATIGIGQITSTKFKMPSRGTPQGAIISPLLFNIGMCRLARQLDQIPDLGYTLYADNITLWAARGPLGHKEHVLQQAAEAVEKFSRSSGLKYAPEKSQVIRVHSRGYISNGPVNIVVEGHAVQEVTTMRVLGFWLQSSGKASHTIKTLKTTTNNIAQMIRRVTYRNAGMKEHDTLRLVQALVISRVTYGLPYHLLSHEEERARPYPVEDFRDTLAQHELLADVIALGAYRMSHVGAVTLKDSEAVTKIVSVGELLVKGNRCLVIDPANQDV
ncbi:uncharacterized protein LOC119441764 [Dermacentor silvarum]|uniref:uncharacterized protein LOC119441764 n=1 Tax=Dermacentor silvarum TaxID=543639 RepID=UPI00189B4D07|nr:uncharacterized protein LOC119441764 [Dermacentor silvarum]